MTDRSYYFPILADGTMVTSCPCNYCSGLDGGSPALAQTHRPHHTSTLHSRSNTPNPTSLHCPHLTNYGRIESGQARTSVAIRHYSHHQVALNHHRSARLPYH